MNVCCEEGKQYTGGRCWTHKHREVTFKDSETAKYANEYFIDEKAFYKKAMKTKWD